MTFPWEIPASAFIVLCSFAYAMGRFEKTPPPPPSNPSDSASDILLVTLDTTRADHLSCYGYPRGTTPEIDRLVLACLDKNPDRRPQNAEELFHMAYACRSCDGWNQTLAAEWWKTHLPELTGPLSLDTPAPERAAGLAAV